MKICKLFTAYTVCDAAFDRKSPKTDTLDGRLGKPIVDSTQWEDDGCGPNFSPVIEIFSSISNSLGPQIMGNLFLESIENTRKNLISSPFTLATQMALLFEATDGDTREQLKKLTLMTENGQLEALKQLKDQYDCVTNGSINAKNAFFIDNSFKPKSEFYKKIRYIGANMYKVDFASDPDMSRVLIDAWAAGMTGTHHKMSLPENSISSKTSLMMFSSATFNAKWKVQFEDRYPGGFLLPDGTTKMVDMMEATYPMQHVISCVDNPYVDDCEPNKAIPTMVEIPLESNRLQVIVLKPNKVLPKEAIVALSPDYFHQLWLPTCDNNLKTVKLRLPKIEIESQYEMSNALFGMGIEDAFLPFKANFTPLTDDIGISLSNTYQQNYLKWDLEGAAAGVANAMTIKLPFGQRSSSDANNFHDHEISVDESFIVFITDRKTKTNLFMGVVNDPR